MELEDLHIYQEAINIGLKIWLEVMEWDNFSKYTIGKQIIRSVDSIASNISEAYGRFHYKDSQKFNYYARGSLFETKTWLIIVQKRKLISDKNCKILFVELNRLGVKLNNYITSSKKQFS